MGPYVRSAGVARGSDENSGPGDESPGKGVPGGRIPPGNKACDENNSTFFLDIGNKFAIILFIMDCKNIKHQTSNIKHQTSNIKHQMRKEKGEPLH
jgi:hypothetical protein